VRTLQGTITGTSRHGRIVFLCETAPKLFPEVAKMLCECHVNSPGLIALFHRGTGSFWPRKERYCRHLCRHGRH
jgi:hypothetical protein